jgi:hypothetical protein
VTGKLPALPGRHAPESARQRLCTSCGVRVSPQTETGRGADLGEVDPPATGVRVIRTAEPAPPA